MVLQQQCDSATLIKFIFNNNNNNNNNNNLENVVANCNRKKEIEKEKIRHQ